MTRSPLTSYNGQASVLSSLVIPRNIYKASRPLTWCFLTWTELRKCNREYYSCARDYIIHCEQSNVTSLQGSPFKHRSSLARIRKNLMWQTWQQDFKELTFRWLGQFVLKLHLVLNLFSFKWLSHLVLWRWKTQLRNHCVAVTTGSFILLSTEGKKDSPEQNVP